MYLSKWGSYDAGNLESYSLALGALPRAGLQTGEAGQ
jgi:hypothetical protein